MALRRHAIALKQYNPDQPRVPAGKPDGGQGTSASRPGAGTILVVDSGDAVFVGEGAENGDLFGNVDDFSGLSGDTEGAGPEETDDTLVQRTDDEFSSASRRGGHHFVPQSLYRDLPLQPQTKAVLDAATTGPLAAQRHGFSREHQIYNDAVKDLFSNFMTSRGISPQELTPDDARRFVDQVKSSADPRVRDLNMRIFQREINEILRRRGRRPE